MGGALLAGALWLGVGIFALGTAWRIAAYVRTPLPRPLPLMPAPVSAAGVAWRLALEVFAFRTLFRADRVGWMLGWLLHAGLTLVLVRHLWLVADDPGGWIAPLLPLGPWLSGALIVSLVGLLLRRGLQARLRYVSTPSDYLWLLFLLGLVASGVVLGYHRPHALAQGLAFSRGLLGEGPLPPAPDLALWLHVGLAAGLLGLFPFSKLLHAPGIFVSPTFAARDRARMER